MNRIYENKMKLMSENYRILKDTFKMEHDLSKHLIALSYAVNNKRVEPEQIKSARSYLKENTGAFSVFRGTTLFPLCGLICGEDDQPEKRLQFMIDHLKIAKAKGFKNSMYLPTALYTLSKVAEEQRPEDVLSHAVDLYKEMRQIHPFLTGGDDYALAILLANGNTTMDTIERYYSALSQAGFSKTNGLQMMSHILSFNPKSVSVSVSRCKNLYDILKEHKLKVSSNYYPAVAFMTLLDDSYNDEMIDIVKTLSKEKGYKWLGKGMYVMLASALVASCYINPEENDMMTTTLQVSIQSIIAAQQAVMIAAISASTAASAAT